MIFDTEYGTLDIGENDINMFKDMLNDNIASFATKTQEQTFENRRSRFRLSGFSETTKKANA